MSTRVKIVILIVATAVIAFAVMRTSTPAPMVQPLPQIYSNSVMGFSLHLPNGYVVDESYKYQELGPGKDILGTSFTIPESFADGTNLGSDSYISVEKIPNLQSCIAGPFLWREQRITLSPDTDITPFLVASSTGAAAGNRYEDVVYALSGTNPCIAVRYFIHYAVIDNYPAGAVREFDRATLIATFDAIRHSLKVVQ